MFVCKFDHIPQQVLSPVHFCTQIANRLAVRHQTMRTCNARAFFVEHLQFLGLQVPDILVLGQGGFEIGKMGPKLNFSSELCMSPTVVCQGKSCTRLIWFLLLWLVWLWQVIIGCFLWFLLRSYPFIKGTYMFRAFALLADEVSGIFVGSQSEIKNLATRLLLGSACQTAHWPGPPCCPCWQHLKTFQLTQKRQCLQTKAFKPARPSASLCCRIFFWFAFFISCRGQ